MTDVPRCDTCGQPLPQRSLCRCGHLESAHRIDLQRKSCGQAPNGEPCECPEFHRPEEGQ